VWESHTCTLRCQPPVAASIGPPPSEGTPASGPTRHVIPRPQTGYAAGQSAEVLQICRLPGMPQAGCIWHVWPPPSQHTNPVVQSAEVAQIVAVPLGHADPAWQVLEPPPSAELVQQTWPVAQSDGAAQI
jgi:hypothetical protein